MDILLFGGAFDPAHLGHKNILKGALAFKKFDKIIVMPTGTPGHKNRCSTPFAVRKYFAQLNFQNLAENIEFSDFEGESKEKSYSCITINHIKEEYPTATIHFLIGGDSAINFTKWKNWQYICENVKLLVFSRDDESDLQLCQAVKQLSQYGSSELINAEILEISSTQLRKIIAKGEDASKFLEKSVYDTIKQYNIYSEDYYDRNIGTSRLLIPLMLGEKRSKHSFCVEALAVQLAQQYGADVQKARLCALLHDIMKEVNDDILLHRAAQSGIINKIADKPKAVLHGFAAADFAQKEMGIDDSETLWAIKSHTCGRKGMSRLEKIIYLADMLCEGRSFPERDYLLSLTFKNLDIAMREALKASIIWLKQKGNAVDSDSIEALEYFEEITSGRNA